jgi:hypothetical protein
MSPAIWGLSGANLDDDELRERVKFDHETDAIHEDDKAYFRRHPERKIRVRPSIGSFERQGGDATVVVQVAEGVRIRLPFMANPLLCLKALNEDEDALAAMIAASPMGEVLAALDPW